MQTAVARMATLVAVLAVLALGLPLALAAQSMHTASFRADAQMLAQRVGAAVSKDAVAGDPIELPTVPAGSTVSVYGPGGRLLGGTAPGAPPPPVAAALAGATTSTSSGGIFVLGVPVHTGEQVIAAVLVRADQTPLQATILRGWAAITALAGLVIGLAFLVARWWGARLTAPLRTLGAQVAASAAGDVSVHASASRYPEITALAAQYNRTAQRLQRSLARQRSLTAATSHQLRTPLAGLRLSLDAALSTPDADLRGALDAALAAADRLEDTIAEVSSLSIDAGDDQASADVDALLQSVYDERSGPLALRDRPLRIERRGPTPPVTAPPAALRQTLGVLLDNAVVHGGGAIALATTTLRGCVILSVTDEGRDPATHPAAPPGSGLGLPLAGTLTEAFGGHLQVNDRDRGWSVSILLPTAGDQKTRGPEGSRESGVSRVR